jgi:hypothetical protein
MSSRCQKLLWRADFLGWCARAVFRITWRTITHIPPPEKLWRSIHRKDQVYANGGLKPAFFRDNRGGLSCDLARVSTIERSRRGYGVPPQWPEEAGLAEFRVQDVWDNGSDVAHRPTKAPFRNYSHCQLTAPLGSRGEVCMSKTATIVVRPRVRDKK